MNKFKFYEFFAGAGMARCGLGEEGWTCLFANDFDHKKSRSYEQNWGLGILKTADVRTLTPSELPDTADLVWASFPCQDLSLAGSGAGLRGDRSGTFWPFWRLMQALNAQDRQPKLIVLENVCGTITSHDGKDFNSIFSSLHEAGYLYGALVIDAELFVPQSRPRLFIVALRADAPFSELLTSPFPSHFWHTRALRLAVDNLPSNIQDNWVWWQLPAPARRNMVIADILEEEPESVFWHTPTETEQLIGMMSPINRAKLERARKAGIKKVGAIYKRTRADEVGAKVQRAEVRFDDIAGCLRTPAGGSSRQIILVVEGPIARSRLISSRETARLMGLPDSYILPANYNEAYHLTGDGVVVPVVRHLAKSLLEPLLANHAERLLLVA